MRCIKCNNETPIKVLEEETMCPDCGRIYIMNYYVCEECNLLWLATDNDFLEGIVLPGIDLYEEVAEFLGLEEIEEVSMNSFMHRCLQCNTVAYEKKKNLWHCPECGFEWEIVNNEQQ